MTISFAMVLRWSQWWVYFFGIVVFHYNVKPSKASDVKTWVKDTNFDSSRNWEGGRLPCSNDRVIFPASTPIAVFMPESYSVAEMVLPLNGELIFPDKVSFSINGGSQADSCIGRDVRFSPQTDFWYDPDNWNITSDRALPRFAARRNNAVPHAYQVPCRTDYVHFPPKTTFRVHSINPEPSIVSLNINNIEYGQEDFNALVNSRTGKLLFPDNPNIQITGTPCTDNTGCTCGNEDTQILSVICKHKLPCPKLDCLDPIQLTGHCCPSCAAKLLLEYDTNFQMDQLLQLLQNFQDKDAFRLVDSFTSKTKDGKIQSVFRDSNSNQIANRLAQLIFNALSADVDGNRLYGIRSVNIQKSEKWVFYSESGSSGISSGGIAALVIIIIIASGFAAAFYVYRKRQIQGFTFARFDLRSDKIELELGTTPHDDLQPGDNGGPTAPSSSTAQDQSKGFDNPVYGTNITSETSAPMEDIQEVGDFVENPMFMIFEDLPKKEESVQQ